MDHVPTDEQRAIFAAVRDTKNDLVIEALAGSAKTTSIIESLAFIPQKSILLCAFNKRIQETLLQRLPPIPQGTVVHVRTFHSQGLAMLKGKYPKLVVNKEATEDLVNRAGEKIGLAFNQRRAAVKLLRFLKETISDVSPKASMIEAIGYDEDSFVVGKSGMMSTKQVKETCEVVRDAYLAGADFSKRTAIDFCDMVWGPIVSKLTPTSRYQAVIVDEAQDISAPQLEMLRMLVAPGGRFIAVGDKYQEIYSWRGSNAARTYATFRARGAIFLPLTITFRCAQVIVEAAQELVPDLQARENAPKGTIRTINIDALTKELAAIKWIFKPTAGSGLNAEGEGDDFVWSVARDAWLSGKPLWEKNLEQLEVQPAPHELRDTIRKWEAQKRFEQDKFASDTFVLSRNNADLLLCALKLWKERVSFQLNAGRDMLEPLYTILDGLVTNSTHAIFLGSLATWYDSESKRAEAAHATAWAERLEEQFAMLKVAAEYAKPNQIRKLIGDMIEASTSGIFLSTVHKVKGLEAERVFLLKQTFGRHQPRSEFDNPIEEEEFHIEYVAITRAKNELVWVDMRSVLRHGG